MTKEEKELEELYKKLDEKGTLEKIKKLHEELHKSQ